MRFLHFGDEPQQWKDKRNVCVIRNAHVLTMMDSVNRQGKPKRKPNIVHIYNNHMTEINGLDQMLLYHSALRKNYKVVQESSDSHHGNLSQQFFLYVC